MRYVPVTLFILVTCSEPHSSKGMIRRPGFFGHVILKDFLPWIAPGSLLHVL